ncbi:unnamed protein product [Phytophthora lilii]|uniref:Unnamed protein product n=1 Tax=Phytophthora lilii TaxID=2077276 RepID=A0A9W6TDC5_9STRA|nr:unnamed protein product [Phytophthora lilii]
MFHAFGLLFVCADEPSEHLFPMTPRFAAPDLPGCKPYSQEEAIMYWESLSKEDNEHELPSQKRERKRPNVASYITEVIRDVTKAMSLSVSQTITPHVASHSLRRGAAAYANASPKLSIQWISTRGAWLLESLTKAFAYIGTTSKEDQSVAKALAEYEAPDLPVTTPLSAICSNDCLYWNMGNLALCATSCTTTSLTSRRALQCSPHVVDATFASLLIHMESVLHAVASSDPGVHVSRYRYELERGIAATNARLGCSLSISTCIQWETYLTERWRTSNHAQISGAVSGGDTVLTSTTESILRQLTSISDRLGRVEDALAGAAARLHVIRCKHSQRRICPNTRHQ